MTTRQIPRYADETMIGSTRIAVGLTMVYVADDADYDVTVRAIDIANRKALVSFIGRRPDLARHNQMNVRLAHLLPVS